MIHSIVINHVCQYILIHTVYHTLLKNLKVASVPYPMVNVNFEV